MDNENKPLMVPAYVIDQLQLIKKPFDDYFLDNLVYLYAAAKNRKKDSNKHMSLKRLEDEAQENIKEARDTFNSYLDKQVEMKPATEEVAMVRYSEAFLLIIKSEAEYKAVLDQVIHSRKEIGARIEIEESFGDKHIIAPRKKAPIDIKEAYPILFLVRKIAMHVIDIFKVNGYISENEVWIGNSGNKGELRGAYLALKRLGYLNPVVNQNKRYALLIFYKRFSLFPEEKGIDKPYICSRSLTELLENSDYLTFKELFELRLKK